MMMRWFLDAIDLSNNLTRALWAVNGIKGPVAGIYALLIVLPLACVTGVLAWIFDLRATLVASQSGVQWVMGNLNLTAEWLIALNVAAAVTFAITLAPTLFELGGPLFARAGITIAQAAVYGLCLFDAITDAPVTNEFLQQYAASFETLPQVVSTVVYGITFLLWLFLASYGFELLCVIFTIVSIKLLLNARLPIARSQSQHVG
jgi:hypothetical protein